MKKFFAWLGAATLALIARAPEAAAAPNDPLKPYIVLDLDTSGSMDEATGSGPPSCGGPDTKLNHARCAISNIVDSYGDIEFALGRFRTVMGGTTTAATFPTGCCVAGPSNGANGACTAGLTCTATDDMFEMLAPLLDGGNAGVSLWTNLTGNTCTATGSDPELWSAAGNTPLEGTLRGTKKYWQGLQATNFTIWPSNQPGFDPIRTDLTRTAFLPAGCNPSPTCTTNCCATQCRPYIVILLTDGAETCNGTPQNGAASLLQTDVDNRRYRVETKPIGFGIAPGNAQIEAIAHGGGAPDLPGNEGFYASDQAGLELAISEIIADSIRTESCNDLDDDCDGAVDEDFIPGKGDSCDNGKLGVCRRTGNLVCRADGTGLQCNAPAGPAPGTEVCNNLDDDCDGKVDEGLSNCTCSPQAERCDGVDQDCDNKIDEGLTRQCGTGTCLGIETCTNGVFTGCTAAQPGVEVCNGLDDNCDGVRDGFTEACSDMPPVNGNPAGDPKNNPGEPTNNPIPQNICHPGLKTCPANVGPPNDFGPCIGEQQPKTEVCNGIDDDCDNEIDEDTGGADCSTNCGVGVEACVNGQLKCSTTMSPDDETCDGNDDDCDGKIDEDFVCSDPPNCDCTAPNQCNAKEQCINGHVVCQGTPTSQESCNCADDDCDGVKDDGALCGANESCTADCQCALPCQITEFPCPIGKVCNAGFCVGDPCFNKDCPPVNGNAQVCDITYHPHEQPPTAACVDKCSKQSCPSTEICYGPTGECAPNDCRTFGCPNANELCKPDANGVYSCQFNPCVGVTCAAGQYCVGGNCFGSCADVDCPQGQRCRLGMCEADPCGMPCPFGRVCHDDTGECVDDPCRVVTNCGPGKVCDPNKNGECVPDACLGVTCPDPSQVCKLGTCYDPNDFMPFLPDAGPEVHVTTGGSGCDTGGGGAGLLLGLALLLVRRRRS
jgi:putative metal-binding protein